jgi:hypothetical protein
MPPRRNIIRCFDGTEFPRVPDTRPPKRSFPKPALKPWQHNHPADRKMREPWRIALVGQLFE